MSANRLGDETSPYLLQHKDNPVHWRAWNPDSLAEAKASNKPILLSVGYAACHWCHVMAHESFEDADTAALMNQLFIPIKVDREERPDIDAIYQAALALLGEQGGWPLTMFLTSDAEPFWGGTYFPPEPRYGRPGFPQVLQGLSDAFKTKRDTVTNNVASLREALAEHAAPTPGAPITTAALDIAAGATLRMIDGRHGGTAGAPKFPQTSLFELLWRAYWRNGDESMGRATMLTLDRMCQGGIYDHLGGGFARYSTDAEWLVPHFEKMLYDNAGLIGLLTLAWQRTGNGLFARRVEETIGWVLREMIAERGAFAASFDADSEGEEGKFCVWSQGEIESLLPADQAKRVIEVYGVSAAGNWEGHNILHRNHPAGAFDEAGDGALDTARATLLAARAKRIQPGRDDKVLADWNGMMIAALARAAFAFDRPEWLAAARRAFDAVVTHMTRKDAKGQTRLGHSLRLGRLQADAMLDDYAHMARAAIALFEASSEAALLDQAEAWLGTAQAHYADKSGGYFLTADDAPTLIVRTKSALDSAYPSGNAIMVEALARLYHLRGKAEHRDRAECAVSAFAGELGRNFPSMGALLNGWEILARGVRVTISGRVGDPARTALLRAAADTGEPNMIVAYSAEGSPSLAGTAPLPKDRAAALVCRGETCSLPVTEPAALAKEILGA